MPFDLPVKQHALAEASSSTAWPAMREGRASGRVEW
jgi:hypothetical protein